MRSLLVLLLLARLAHADDKPWAAGVSPEEQKTALAIYDQGNTDFVESRYTQALAKYHEALKHWDHPAIHFNMAVSLINVDAPVEAYEHLEAALKFGAAPLGDKAYAQALAYKQQLEAKLARLHATSAVDGSTVTLDGKPLLAGAGEVTRVLAPGVYQIVATKSGFVTETQELTLAAGKTQEFEVHLIAETAPRYREFTPGWTTFRIASVVAVGAGMVACGLGVKFGIDARNDANAINNNKTGWTAADQATFTNGQNANRDMIISYIVGGALAIGGGVAYWRASRTRLVPVVNGIALAGSF